MSGLIRITKLASNKTIPADIINKKTIDEKHRLKEVVYKHSPLEGHASQELATNELQGQRIALGSVLYPLLRLWAGQASFNDLEQSSLARHGLHDFPDNYTCSVLAVVHLYIQRNGARQRNQDEGVAQDHGPQQVHVCFVFPCLAWHLGRRHLCDHDRNDLLPEQ